VSGSNLQRVLAAGHFAVTTEVGPPRGPSPAAMRRKAGILRGVADAYNVTDNQTAVVRMSSIAGAKLLLDEGLEPVMQMTCRDRNRIAIQSDLLGAWALGIRNCLVISGDHQQAGAHGKLRGHPGAKNVYDLDSVQLLSVMRGMGQDGLQQSGDPIKPAAPFFVGAAWTPLAPPEAFRPMRLGKKVAAGASFIQTQAVYDVERFATAMAAARQLGLTDRVAILAGIIVPRSARMLRYMSDNVPGVEVPEHLIERMAASSDPRTTGIAIAVELIAAVRQIDGVAGAHLQAIEAEALVPDVLEAAQLLPRPEITSS